MKQTSVKKVTELLSREVAIKQSNRLDINLNSERYASNQPTNPKITDLKDEAAIRSHTPTLVLLSLQLKRATMLEILS